MKELLIASTAFALFVICPRMAGMTNVIADATSPGLYGSVSMLPEWAYIAASILFALLIVIAFARKYAAYRARTDANAAFRSAACGCESCGDTESEKPEM